MSSKVFLEIRHTKSIILNQFINSWKLKLSLSLAVIIMSFLITPYPDIHAESNVPTHTISIGIGSIQDSSGEYAIIGESVGPDKVINNAEYSWVSSDTKTVKVNEATGALTGMKTGKAMVSVKQTLDGKTLVVTKWEVTVNNTAKIMPDYEPLPYGKNVKDKIQITSFCNCINTNAAYKIKSSDTSIVSFKSTANKKNDFRFNMTTKKTGTAVLTIYQVLGGKTNKIGKVKFCVKNAYLLHPEDETIELGSCLTMLIDCADSTKTYKTISSDLSVLDTQCGFYEIYPTKEGTVTVSFYENNKLFAAKKVTVKCTPMTKATLSYALASDNTKIDPTDNDGITLFINKEDNTNKLAVCFDLEFDTEPNEANGHFCKASVDNETVCSAKAYDDEGELIVSVYVHKAGTAKLTIINHLGDVIYSGNITVITKQ